MQQWLILRSFHEAQFSLKQLLGPASIIIQPGAGGRNMDSVVLLANLVNGAETSSMQISVYSIFNRPGVARAVLQTPPSLIH